MASEDNEVIESQLAAELESKEEITGLENQSNEGEILVSDEIKSKDYGHCDNDQICIYEQDSEVYLRIAGFLEGLEDQLKTIDINRNIFISADNNVLIVKFSELLGAQEWRFSSALIVLQPKIQPCRRNNPCKQIIRYIEQPAYVDIGIDSGDTHQLQVCTLISAFEGRVYLLERLFEDCDCNVIDPFDGVSYAKSAKLAEFPSAERFLLHLKYRY